MLLLNLLNALLSKNYFDVDNDDDEEQQALNRGQATEVCILGLQYIMPLITVSDRFAFVLFVSCVLFMLNVTSISDRYAKASVTVL